MPRDLVIPLYSLFIQAMKKIAKTKGETSLISAFATANSLQFFIHRNQYISTE